MVQVHLDQHSNSDKSVAHFSNASSRFFLPLINITYLFPDSSDPKGRPERGPAKVKFITSPCQ